MIIHGLTHSFSNATKINEDATQCLHEVKNKFILSEYEHILKNSSDKSIFILSRFQNVLSFESDLCCFLWTCGYFPATIFFVGSQNRNTTLTNLIPFLVTKPHLPPLSDAYCSLDAFSCHSLIVQTC